jgi:DNA polymerase III alpha subunit (gram-positive type)
MGALYDAIAKSEYTEKIAAFYDYFEIYHTKDKTEKDIYKKIFELGEELGVPVIATGN